MIEIVQTNNGSNLAAEALGNGVDDMLRGLLTETRLYQGKDAWVLSVFDKFRTSNAAPALRAVRVERGAVLCKLRQPNSSTGVTGWLRPPLHVNIQLLLTRLQAVGSGQPVATEAPAGKSLAALFKKGGR